MCFFRFCLGDGFCFDWYKTGVLLQVVGCKHLFMCLGGGSQWLCYLVVFAHLSAFSLSRSSHLALSKCSQFTLVIMLLCRYIMQMSSNTYYSCSAYNVTMLLWVMSVWVCLIVLVFVCYVILSHCVKYPSCNPHSPWRRHDNYMFDLNYGALFRCVSAKISYVTFLTKLSFLHF